VFVNNIIIFTFFIRFSFPYFRYYEFDKEKSLSDNLEGKLVVEFPTVYVVLSDKADQFTLLRDGKLV